MNKLSVNWELAPEGTTHYMPENDDFHSSWLKRDVFGWQIWCRLGGKWHNEPWNLNKYLDTFVIKPVEDIEVIWDGNGLPPVGTVCEWFSEDYGWLVGRVVGHDDDLSVISLNDGYTGCHPHQVRPLPTPEQIAEEDGRKTINKELEKYKNLLEFYLKELDNEMCCPFGMDPYTEGKLWRKAKQETLVYCLEMLPEKLKEIIK